LSTDAEINGGSASPVEETIGDSKTGTATTGSLTTDDSNAVGVQISGPTVPRADAVDGLAHGAVTDAAETTVIEIPRLAPRLASS
jgi:hypothetical protein